MNPCFSFLGKLYVADRGAPVGEILMYDISDINNVTFSGRISNNTLASFGGPCGVVVSTQTQMTYISDTRKASSFRST